MELGWVFGLATRGDMIGLGWFLVFGLGWVFLVWSWGWDRLGYWVSFLVWSWGWVFGLATRGGMIGLGWFVKYKDRFKLITYF